MSKPERHHRALQRALQDGPLRPGQLRSAAGLTRGQVDHALRWAAEREMELHEIVTYHPNRRVYLIPQDRRTMAEALLPGLRGMVTRCDRTLEVLNAAAMLHGEDQFTTRSRNTIEAHRDYALEMVSSLEGVLAEED